jgi:NTE family protein
MNLDKDIVLKLGSILGIEDMPYRRMLFEHIIPKLGELLDVEKVGSYEDIVLALYERVAQRHGVERFKVYSYEDFINAVISKFKPSGEKISHRIPKILKHSDLLLRTIKDDILDEIVDEFFKNLS